MKEFDADADADAYIDSAATLLGYELSPESREQVKANLALLRANAANFMGLPLDPHLDPAAVLRL